MDRKIKLLFYTELWVNAGIESVIMNYLRNLDRSCMTIDIMASQGVSDFYDEEIVKLGGRKIITLKEEYASPAKRMIANRNVFANYLKENSYDIVHIHMCNAAAMIYGKIAKKNGVRLVVYHSHSTDLGQSHHFVKTIVHYLSRFRYERYGDLLFSCSDLASKWMFSKKVIRSQGVILIKNGIELDKFGFSEEMRKQYRERLNIGNRLLVGHIGRFTASKNHLFLLTVFYELHKKNSETALVLIGEGEMEAEIRDKVKQLNLSDAVIFPGATKEIPQMLWAMDIFVLPSYFEGNPVVGIEAQAASTPCLFSDKITRMCNVTGLVSYLPLTASPTEWRDSIIEIARQERVRTNKKMQEAGYDIRSVACEIQKLYENTLSR